MNWIQKNISSNIKVINNNLNNTINNNNSEDAWRIRDFCDQKSQDQQKTTTQSHQLHQRPTQLFKNKNLSVDENVNFAIKSPSPSSEEDNSPTELNNYKRLHDKPPLVKRLTVHFTRPTEDSRPLVMNNPSPTSGIFPQICDGYVNEGICDTERIIANKFGDSCKQSFNIEMDRSSIKDHLDFDLKKRFLRETSSANSSPKIKGPMKPNYMVGVSMSELNELKSAPWFQAGIPREISMELLMRQSPGAFLVRHSSTKPGCFALSLRVPPPAPKVAHYLILRTSRGYKIKGFTKEFSSLRALITHHSVMRELLPVPLALPRPVTATRRDSDSDTYGSLNDFRKMMADLNV